MHSVMFLVLHIFKKGCNYILYNFNEKNKKKMRKNIYFFPQGELMVKKELDREGADVSVDEQGNARFTLRITATDQAEPAAARKSSTVTVRTICMRLWLVCGR